MAPRRKSRRSRKSRIQWYKENGFVAIKAQESYQVEANALEIPANRSFKAKTLSVHLTASAPLIVQCELMAPGSRPVWRCAPISVGVIPVRRTFRWPSSAAAMWPSGSTNTVFKIVLPCPGQPFAGAYVSCNYTVVVQLSADYDQQICPKQHGVITPLRHLVVREPPCEQDLPHQVVREPSRDQDLSRPVVREPTAQQSTFKCDHDLAHFHPPLLSQVRDVDSHHPSSSESAVKHSPTL